MIWPTSFLNLHLSPALLSLSLSWYPPSLSLSPDVTAISPSPLILITFSHFLKVAFLSFFILLSFLGWHFYLPFSSLPIFKWQMFSIFLSSLSWCNESYFSLLLSARASLGCILWIAEKINFFSWFLHQGISFIRFSFTCGYLLTLGFSL